MGVTAEHAPAFLSEVTRLLAECLSDEPNTRQAARRTFQAEYGTVIYHFPIKIGGLSAEDAGDRHPSRRYKNDEYQGARATS